MLRIEQSQRNDYRAKYNNLFYVLIIEEKSNYI